ncbi:hypothetical protein [Candidatus Protochlamydia phocaeensis]|uniref:hypothetical protein n=1 Tax=Candidatus Protochlamydia phocaeensis TaxID=1414722 RepID=UPI000838225B|nr:hypothetical protein [Candidatus Protochlamydia phocaeensis]
MKLKTWRSWMIALCAGFTLMNSFPALLVAEEQLTPVECMKIEEERMAQFPKEALAQAFDLNALIRSKFNDEDYLYRIHSDSYYYPVAVSGSGDVVQLNDASKWSVHPYQRHIVMHWVQSDLIFIKPKASCFSMYSYVLQNRTTQEAVEVNLIGSPIPTGAYTHWIVNIDPYKKLIQLNDDTIWQIDPNDYAFNKWQIGHRLIVGVNNYWRIAKYPHILINTSLYNAPYSEGDFIGYPAGY